MRKIRELGSLPADAFDKYQGLPLSQVRQHTHTLTHTLTHTVSSCGRNCTSVTLSSRSTATSTRRLWSSLSTSRNAKRRSLLARNSWTGTIRASLISWTFWSNASLRPSSSPSNRSVCVCVPISCMFVRKCDGNREECSLSELSLC